MMIKNDANLIRAYAICFTIAVLFFLVDSVISNLQITYYIDIFIVYSAIVFIVLHTGRKSKSGLYFSHKGLHYYRNQKLVNDPWEQATVQTLINLPFWKVALIKINGKKYRFSMTWLNEDSLLKICPMIPTNHELRQLAKSYIEFRKLEP